MDPRDLNEALEREPYHTHSTGKLQQNFQAETEWNMLDISQHSWKCAWMTTSLLLQRKPNNSIFKTKPLSKAVQHTAHRRRKLFIAMQNSHQAWKHTNFPRETVPARKREIFGYRYIYIRNYHFD